MYWYICACIYCWLAELWWWLTMWDYWIVAFRWYTIVAYIVMQKAKHKLLSHRSELLMFDIFDQKLWKLSGSPETNDWIITMVMLFWEIIIDLNYSHQSKKLLNFISTSNIHKYIKIYHQFHTGSLPGMKNSQTFNY